MFGGGGGAVAGFMISLAVGFIRYVNSGCLCGCMFGDVGGCMVRVCG